MRIGFDAKRLYNNFTGLGNYSRNILSNLSEYYPDIGYYLYSPKIKITPETKQFYNSPSFTTFIPKSVIKSLWRSVGIINQLKKDKIQIFHGLSNEIPVNINKSGIKSIVTIHDLVFKILPDTYGAIDKKIYDSKCKYSCKKADKIVAVSQSTKNDIIKFYQIPPEKIQVIYQNCDNIFYSLKPKLENAQIIEKHNLPSEYLLYVGSVTERKNLLSIIKAINYLPSSYKTPIVVVGKGENYQQEVKKYISKNNLEHLVIWKDNISSNTDLQAIYQKALLFIFPSFYEGFGIPVLEALLSKTPVITSNISSLPEAGGPGSYYIDPSQPEQIAKGIEKILSDNKYRENMIEQGLIHAQNFNREKVTTKMVNLYKKIL